MRSDGDRAYLRIESVAGKWLVEHGEIKMEQMWYAVFGLVLSMVAVAGAVDAFIPNEVSVFRDEAWPVYHFVTLDQTENTGADVTADVQTTKADAKLFGVLPIKQVDVNTFAHKKLYPGGMLFGVKF